MLNVPKTGGHKTRHGLPKDLSKEIVALKKENASLKRKLSAATKASPKVSPAIRRSKAATLNVPQPPAAKDDLLEVEMAHYLKLKPELLKKHLGKYAVIKGRDLIGVYDDAETAYQAGRKLLGNVPMLLREITLKERVYFFPSVFVEMRHDAPT